MPPDQQATAAPFPQPAGAGARAPLRVPRLVVFGGGATGAGYVRQLLRAVGAGRLSTERILVLDRDPACAAARERDPRVVLETADWSEWLDARLVDLDAEGHLVPYHWAPHLLVGWLERQARQAGARVSRGEPVPPRGLPFERPTREGDRALSYAGWICPPTCIEPALCPHTRGPRDWSLAADLAAARVDEPFDERIVFRCLHLVWGVGTVPVEAVLAARRRLLARLRRGPARWLVATSSHCHALATVLDVAPGGGLATAPGDRT